MAHTAEALCQCFLTQEELDSCNHGDVHHGFLLSFPEKEPDLNLEEIEQKVQEMIAQDIPIDYVDESHILIGGKMHDCTGPRTHVRSTGKIQGFRLLHHLVHDPYAQRWLMVGCVGEDSEEHLKQLNRLYPDGRFLSYLHHHHADGHSGS